MEVTETLLPGVGMRYEFETEKRQRVGVIVSGGNIGVAQYARMLLGE